MKRLIYGMVAAAVFLFSIGTATANGYPNDTIRFVIPYPPGGATDVIARLVATKLTERLENPVIVENRPGAGGEIAVDQVLRAKPDGYTLLVTTTNFTVAPFINKNVSRDSIKDFTHIIGLVQGPWLIAVNKQMNLTKASDLIGKLKQSPGEVNWGMVGAEDLEVEHFLSASETDVQKIRYGGTAPLMRALVKDEVQIVMSTMRGIQSFYKSGDVFPVAVTTKDRAKALPDIPTVGEDGVPGYDGSSIWFGLSGPKGLDADIVALLNTHVKEILQDPEVAEKVESMNFDILGGTPEEFTAFVNEDVERMSAIAIRTGVKPK